MHYGVFKAMLMDMQFFSELFWVLPGTMTKIFTKGKLLPRMFSEMSKNWYRIIDRIWKTPHSRE